MIGFDYEGVRYGFTHPSESDHIAQRQHKTRTFYERELLEELRRHILPKSLVIDVGAHIGNHTIYFAKVCGAVVLAIEPDPLLTDCLERNVLAHDVNDLVHIVQAAAVAVSDCAVVYDPGAPCNTGMGRVRYIPHTGSIADEALISTWALDDITPADADVAVIKIDVEGFECEVLNGAKRILTEQRPLLAIEAQTIGDLAQQTDLLSQFSYTRDTKEYGATPLYLWRYAR